MEKGSKCLEEVADFFGKGIIAQDGSLDRKALAAIVFSDKAKLEMLNSIIYPYITGEILRQIRRHSANGEKLILLDAPTLFESRADDFCEIIISVLAESGYTREAYNRERQSHSGTGSEKNEFAA